MKALQPGQHTEIYKACRIIVGPERWDRLIQNSNSSDDPESLMNFFIQSGEQEMPKFLPDLARLEWNIEDVSRTENFIQNDIKEILVNPSLRLIDLTWKNLLPLLSNDKTETHAEPIPGRELVLIWKDPRGGRVKYRVASQGDLLALKITDEHISPEHAAVEGNVSVGMIDGIIDDAVHEGILLSPPSRIIRNPSIFSANDYVDESFLSSHSFTLQWHITQACDLSCRHCYDRSTRSPMSLEQGIKNT